MSQSTSGGWGVTAGHPERSPAALRVPREDADNTKRRQAFEDRHPEIEIVNPSSNEIVPLWVARWRREDIPEPERRIYRSDDLGMLMDHLEQRFPSEVKM